MAVFIGILAAIVIGGLVGFVLMTAGAVFRIIMAPALRLPTRASGWPRPRVADLLCLMALLQVSLFPMALSGPIGGHAGALLFIGFAWTITVAIWWEGVKRLTALRVNETRRRVIFLIVVGPLAYGTAILCAVSVLVVVSILFASLYNVFDGSPGTCSMVSGLGGSCRVDNRSHGGDRPSGQPMGRGRRSRDCRTGGRGRGNGTCGDDIAVPTGSDLQAPIGSE